MSPSFSSMRLLGSVLGLGAFSLFACSSTSPTDDSSTGESEEALASPCTLGTSCPATIHLVRSQAQIAPAELDGWVRGDVFHADEDAVFFRQRTTAPLILPAGKKIALSGSPSGDSPWNVDDALLIEVLRVNGSVSAVAQVGAVDLHTASGLVPRLGRVAFEFAGGEIDLTSMVPQGEAFRLRVSAINKSGTSADNVARVSDVFLRVVGTSPPPPSSDTPFDIRTACPGPTVTYAQLLSKFAPATTKTTLGDIVMDGRKRACHDQTGCAAWEPAGEVPFYKVVWTSSRYRFDRFRSIAVPSAGKVTLEASASSMKLSLSLDAEPSLSLSDDVERNANPVDFRLNPLRIGNDHIQVGGWSSGSGSYLWFHDDRMTDSCLFATSTGRVYGQPSGAYTEYQVVFYGTY